MPKDANLHDFSSYQQTSVPVGDKDLEERQDEANRSEDSDTRRGFFLAMVLTTLLLLVLTIGGKDVPSSSLLLQQEVPEASATTSTTTADVIVIGAGMAGIRAAVRLREAAPQLHVIVLESTDMIGGRVRPFDTANGERLQLGANWLYYQPKHQKPTTLLFEQYLGKNASAYDDYLNSSVYKVEGSSGTVERIPQPVLEPYIDEWEHERNPCMQRLTDRYYSKKMLKDPTHNELDALQAYRMCGWNESDILDFLYKKIWYDYDYSTVDGSIYDWGDSVRGEGIMHFAKGDYNHAIQAYAADNHIQPIFRSRVTKISYHLPGKYQAQVEVLDETTGQTLVYKARRVLSTVSSGVYNNDLIEFDPPLKYPSQQYNPMTLKNYVKIFYQFPLRFWESDSAGQSHYIYILQDDTPPPMNFAWEVNHNHSVSFWQNLDRPEVFPGSHILMLSLFQQGFAKAVGEDKLRDPNIDPQVLSRLLEPLRKTYPGFVEPTAVYHNHFHGDVNFGYGAYSSWDAGYDPYDYYRFWGRYDQGDYVKKCDHNGCNGAKQWILFLSGTDSCMEASATVHGAYYSGEMAANHLMEEMGLNIGKWKKYCN